MCIQSKRHVCGICVKLKSLLKRHCKQVHNASSRTILDVDSYMNVKPEENALRKFGCLLCDKTFRLKSSLRMHLRSHSHSQSHNSKHIKDDGDKQNNISHEKVERISDSEAVEKEPVTLTNLSGKKSMRRSQRTPVPSAKSSKRKQSQPTKKVKLKKRKYTKKQSVCETCDSRFDTKKELNYHYKTCHGDTTEEEITENIPVDQSDTDATYAPLDTVTAIKTEYTKSEHSETEETAKEAATSINENTDISEADPPVEKKRPEVHICKICKFRTIFKNALNVHMKRKHNIDDMQEMESSPPIEPTMEKRRPRPIEKKWLFCEHCNKKFSQERYLQRHLKEEHGEFPAEGAVDYDAPQEKDDIDKIQAPYLLSKRKPVKVRKKYSSKIMCEFCSKVFDARHKYLAHKRQHTNEKPYPCEFCGRRFASRSNLAPHLRTHTGERPHKCDFCDRTFNSITSKKKHLLTHTREYNHSCHICGRQFLLKSHLQEHLKRHMGVKNHQCDQCPKAFVTSSSLKEHYRTHTGERPYVCQVCGKAFARLCHLKSHEKTQHNDPKKSGQHLHNIANKPHHQGSPQKTGHPKGAYLPGKSISIVAPAAIEEHETAAATAPLALAPSTTSPKLEGQPHQGDSHQQQHQHIRVLAIRESAQDAPPQQYMHAMQGMARVGATEEVVTATAPPSGQHFGENPHGGLLNLTAQSARGMPNREQYDLYHAMRREGFLNDHQHLHDLGLLNQIQFLNPNTTFM